MHLSKQWFFGSPPTVAIDSSHPITHNLINYTTFVASVSLSSLSLGLACTVKAGDQNIHWNCISISLKAWISILFRCMWVCMHLSMIGRFPCFPWLPTCTAGPQSRPPEKSWVDWVDFHWGVHFGIMVDIMVFTHHHWVQRPHVSSFNSWDFRRM